VSHSCLLQIVWENKKDVEVLSEAEVKKLVTDKFVNKAYITSLIAKLQEAGVKTLCLPCFLCDLQYTFLCE
jgi:hypothetical protein